jgi:hypothetical protein
MRIDLDPDIFARSDRFHNRAGTVRNITGIEKSVHLFSIDVGPHTNCNYDLAEIGSRCIRSVDIADMCRLERLTFR